MNWAVFGPSMFGYCSGVATASGMSASLGKRLSIDNKHHGVFVDLVLAIEIAQFSL